MLAVRCDGRGGGVIRGEVVGLVEAAWWDIRGDVVGYCGVKQSISEEGTPASPGAGAAGVQGMPARFSNTSQVSRRVTQQEKSPAKLCLSRCTAGLFLSAHLHTRAAQCAGSESVTGTRVPSRLPSPRLSG